MSRQRLVPELLEEEWEEWINQPDGQLTCPVDGCGLTSTAYWDGVNEVLRWTRCKHRAFFPESPAPWPPPETHVRREETST
jgi:hypothetical protein